ncbi:F0F1 ATP synthase subunit gamma [Chloroflexi bacterium TSY]|nr:F0F1 ATP synthase subunit gamma [Chloroflexi bacterium TSY]
MQTLDTLKRKIKSAKDLLSVVQTMKALAAVSIRHAERAVAALADYNRTVEMGLHIVLHTREDISVLADYEPGGRIGLILLGTDQGLCGQFNERLTSYVINKLNGMHIRRADRIFLAVGERGAGLLEDAEQPVEAIFSTPSGISGITPLVQDLLLKIDAWRSEREIDEIWLFHNRPAGDALYQSCIVQLLPLNLDWLQKLKQTPWPSRVLPTFTADADQLFASLIRQHLFVTLYRACAESLASEDASRLTSMQNAENNIRERLDELAAEYHHQRQHSITAELLDIVAGFEAVTTQRY